MILNHELLSMEKTGPQTKALQNIATQLRRIADCMEKHPMAKYIIHVNEGATISGGQQDFAEDITNAPAIESCGANSPAVVEGDTSYHGAQGNNTAQIVEHDGTNTHNAHNTESFNRNSDEALTNLTSAIKR